MAKKEECEFSILTSYYNKYGINDGERNDIVDSRFRTVSTHRSKKSAEKKLKKLCKKSNRKNK